MKSSNNIFGCNHGSGVGTGRSRGSRLSIAAVFVCVLRLWDDGVDDDGADMGHIAAVNAANPSPPDYLFLTFRIATSFM
jgi:hypothetical protein